MPDDERYPLDDAFESDMMLTPIQRQSIERLATPNDARHRKMVSDFRFYWQHGVIPYIVDSSLDLVVSQRLQKAINEWETHTCIRFRPAIDISPENSQVVFKKRNYGCASTVGRVGGRQYANISMFCGVGSIIHELGHIVGFVHEQSRPDRDDYVSILYQNVKTGRRDQFKKYSRKEVETFGIPYDVGSVMHYGSTAFSKKGNLRTIRTNDRQIQMWIGQRDGLSFLDAKLANSVYNCSGCGGSFYGNSGGEIRSPNFPQDYPDNEECYWLIKVGQFCLCHLHHF
ncbi:hypothetical protein FSP39_016381 [Pinctada imbricata]|uniref:Metalloendopeptidase n=1 Tax=Pinctada imbricata TaxID=66713 RepID=A0AA88XHG7_PINIB|nr:hypothetical protein FSP39_016381 [Pinctada imbricata]